MTNKIEIQNLQSELKFIDARLAQIEEKLIHAPPGDYAVQELKSEANTLAAHRRVIDTKIRELSGDNPDNARKLQNQERVEKLRAAKVAAYRKQCFETAEEFEREGDHRNASIMRLEALNARKVAEHEIHD